jgi:hypothetical protein
MNGLRVNTDVLRPQIGLYLYEPCFSVGYLIILSVVRLFRSADMSLAFHMFRFAAQPKEFFFVELKKSEQRSRKCVELRGEYVE